MTLKKTLKHLLRFGIRSGVRMGILPRVIILHVDGGLCSQMHFYMVGKMLERQGNLVIYDLTWFDDSPMDTENRFCRNFDILKLFPALDLEPCTDCQLRRLYTAGVHHHNNYYDTTGDPTAWLNLKAPLYMDGYYQDPEEMYTELFNSLFEIDPYALDTATRELYRELLQISLNESTCAVHVRRGDLAHFVEAYGSPAESDYFSRAMRQITERFGKTKFYIFSDEPDWVETNLVPILADYNITVMKQNGSDRGWCDLALMSACRHQITSQGSMGKYAAMLRDKPLRNGLVTLLSHESSSRWAPRFDNAIVL